MSSYGATCPTTFKTSDMSVSSGVTKKMPQIPYIFGLQPKLLTLLALCHTWKVVGLLDAYWLNYDKSCNKSSSMSSMSSSFKVSITDNRAVSVVFHF